MERILMKLEIYKQELSAEHNAAMAKKVQLEEQKDINDCNLQRVIGALDAMNRAQAIVSELRKADADSGGLDVKKETLVAGLDEAVQKLAEAVKAVRKVQPALEVQPVTGDVQKPTGGTT